jgi:hypothetical protein
VNVFTVGLETSNNGKHFCVILGVFTFHRMSAYVLTAFRTTATADNTGLAFNLKFNILQVAVTTSMQFL